MENVAILTTGGTIEKSLNWREEKLDFKAGSGIANLLNRARVVHPSVYQTKLADSEGFRQKDFVRIVGKLKSLDEERVVVVHGTSTIVQSALACKRANLGKTIVYTGAFVPYSYERSEGAFNIGGALASAMRMDTGVYIWMNGRIFHPDNCVKDLNEGTFKEVKTIGQT